MNTGQMMLTMGALALLSTITFNMYRGFASNGQTIMRAKCGLAAVSIATSMIEEASGKTFDAATNDSSISELSKLTSPNGLGPLASERYPYIDDFDDYNNLSIKLFMSLPDTFYVKCKVFYINPSNPNTPTTTQTWHKKIMVSVTSPTLEDTVKSEYIFSYWYFR